MELTTLYKQYRAAKMAADQAAKEEDKLKKALKKANLALLLSWKSSHLSLCLLNTESLTQQKSFCS